MTGQPTTAGELFTLLWNHLADILGTAATATLIRRAAKRAATRPSPLPTVIVHRDTISYDYELPESWRSGDDPEAMTSFRNLARELGTILTDLTGPIVVQRLAQLSPFQQAGIVFRNQAPAA